MEYLVAFALFFGGWIVVRYLINASYASGFAQGAWHVAAGGIPRVGEIARPIDRGDLEADLEARAGDIGRSLNARDFDQARQRADGLGRSLVTTAWTLGKSLR